MAGKKATVRLTRRDYAILRDAATYGLVVSEFLHAQRFSGRQSQAVTSTLRRLYGRPPKYRYLRPEKLDAQRVYYRLTSQGCRLIGVPRDASRSLGRKAIAERYALNWFICAHTPNARNLFSPRDFPDEFPNISERLPKKRFYLESAEQTMRLGYFVTDLRTDVRRLVRQSCKVMRNFIDRNWFDDYLRNDRFAFTVLTFNDAKATEIRQKLSESFREQLARPLQSLGIDAANGSITEPQVLVVPGFDTLIPEPR